MFGSLSQRSDGACGGASNLSQLPRAQALAHLSLVVPARVGVGSAISVYQKPTADG